MKGKIKFFNSEKGFGFIKTSEGDYFFHISTAKRAGLSDTDLKEEAEFEIEVGIGKKGKEEVTKFITNTPTPKKQNKPRKVATHKNDFTNLDLMSYKGNDRNFYLFLNKPYYLEEHSKMYALQPNKKYGFGLNERFVKKKRDSKGKLVEAKGKEKYEVLDNFSFSGIDCSTITHNQKSNAESLFPHTKECTFKPEWRLTLGLGGASVFDTDITLHHIYGVPYIPASSIKGVVRSYIIETVFDNDEEKAILSKDFCDLFGCAKEHEIHRKGAKKVKKPSYYGLREPTKGDRQGKITFFDALPTDSNKIHISMDIMNVHYKDYYDSPKEKDGKYKKGNMKPPAGWSNPTIINFLTVINTPFQFLLGSKDDSLEKLKIAEKTMDKWLTEALEEHGIGAKTAVGYGYMNKS